MSSFEFTSEEFVEFWEAHAGEGETAVEWMAQQVQTSEGLKKLGQAATILAERHGVSSNMVKTFRTALHNACKKAGLEGSYTPRKRKSDDGEVYMSIEPSGSRTRPKKGGRDWAVAQMSKWINEGRVDVTDLYDAVAEVERAVSSV